MSTGRPHRRLTLRKALILGFGGTFAIWLVAGYVFMKRIGDIEQRTSAVDARYMQAQDLLSSVRAQILLGSVYVRDALLDPNPRATNYRQQLEDTYVALNGALRQYVPFMDSDAERDRVARLQHEIDDFRQTMLDVLGTDSTRWPAEARTLLRTRVVPKRETVIRASEEVQALNRNAFVQQQEETTAIYGATQRQLWVTLGLALAASVAIGLIAAISASRLERRLESQRAREAASARELQHLSAKLITAQEEERRTIARELHDEVGQVLGAIKMELVVAQRTIAANGGSEQVLEDARSIAENALHTVRDLSHLLHPALLDDLGLPATVEWYLRGFSRRYDIRTDLLQEGMDERLAPEVEASAYRIIQEALTNVAKHARASNCRVYLQRLSATCLITVEDDGVGFDEGEAGKSGARDGLGLISIRERARQLQGSVRIESGAGRGTRITVELPARSRTQPAPEREIPAAAAPERAAS